jgi:hypothetical protein
MTRKQFQTAVVTVDYGVLDTIDALRYAFGEQLTFHAHAQSNNDPGPTHSLTSSSDEGQEASAFSSAVKPSGSSEIDQASDDEEGNMLQLSHDDSASSAFPVFTDLYVGRINCYTSYLCIIF